MSLSIHIWFLLRWYGCKLEVCALKHPMCKQNTHVQVHMRLYRKVWTEFTYDSRGRNRGTLILEPSRHNFMLIFDLSLTSLAKEKREGERRGERKKKKIDSERERAIGGEGKRLYKN